MSVTRPELEQRERRILAPFAQFSADSRGRVHDETPPDFRTEYQRDRDRVIHSRAFRRLEYKTQVFLNGTGDHLRTRLTHTMEVAAIARNIARALRINEDLTEAIALAHDLGHSPFGHTGEAALNRLMKGHGGFEHNRQSLRVVELLEQKYPGFSGLNLSWEVREGLAKHFTSFDKPGLRKDFEAKSPSLEAQVANLADEITYYSHDLDDAVDFEILDPAQLDKNEVWHRSLRAVLARYPDAREPELHKLIIRDIIDTEVGDLVSTSTKSIAEAGVQSADEARQQPAPLIRYSDDLLQANLDLRKFLYQNVYYNSRVSDVNRRACEMLRQVFQVYLADPDKLGETAAKRIETEGLHRTVCDYIAGMTDRYLMEEHGRTQGDRLRE